MSKRQPKLTPWFPGHVKPARAGVYECKGHPANQNFQYWNGMFWGGWSWAISDAVRNASLPSMRDAPRWRGLAEKPKAAKP